MLFKVEDSLNAALYQLCLRGLHHQFQQLPQISLFIHITIRGNPVSETPPISNSRVFSERIIDLDGGVYVPSYTPGCLLWEVVLDEHLALQILESSLPQNEHFFVTGSLGCRACTDGRSVWFRYWGSSWAHTFSETVFLLILVRRPLANRTMMGPSGHSPTIARGGVQVHICKHCGSNTHVTDVPESKSVCLHRGCGR